MDAPLTPEMLAEHGRFLRRLAGRLVRDPAAAEDVVQETWLRWFTRPEGTVRRLRAWLAVAARHQSANARRARSRRERHERLGVSPEAPRSPAEEADQAEQLQRLVAAVIALEPAYRETVLALYFRGESARSLARSSGVPVATVRSREARALAKLRARLDREHGSRAAWVLGLARLAGSARASTLVASLGLAGALATAGLLSVMLLRASLPHAERGLELSIDESPADAGGASPRQASRAPAAPSAVSTPLVAREPASGARDESVTEDPDALHGVATDVEGVPLAGVHVRFERNGRESPIAEATSGSDGRFRVSNLAHFDDLEAELPGYVLLHAADPGAKSLEPWEELRLTLARAGTLVVNALDADGRAMEGVNVSVRVAPEDGRGADGKEGALVRAQVARCTDAAGRAVFDDVWAGVKLVLQLVDAHPGTAGAQYESSRHDAGRLCLEPGVHGDPVVVPPGGARELEARWAAEIRLRGSIVHMDGTLAARSTVHVADLGRDGGPSETNLLSFPCADGRFELVVREPYLLGPLRVHAWKDDENGGDEIRTSDGRAAISFGRGGWCGAHELDPRTWDPRAELRLVLEPMETGSIAGRVLDAGGTTLKANRAVLAMQRADPVRRSFARPNQLSLHDDTFCILGLAPGACDIAVSFWPPVTGSTTLVHLFRDVPVGTHDLELRFPSVSPVRVRVRLAGDAASLATLTQAWFPRDGAPGRAGADRQLRASWPAGLPLRSPFHGSVEDERGWTLTAIDRAPDGARELVLEPGAPGWYRFGVLAWDERGMPFVPACTELAWFAAGEHLLDLALAPTAALSGRVLADGAREFLGLSLIAGDGQAVPLVGGGDSEVRSVLSLPTHGRFRIEQVPLGRFTLRVGAVSELIRGRFRREVPVEIDRDGSPRLEIEL